MSRLIEVESLIDQSISVLCGGGNEEMAVLVEDINSAPSIDLIRCAECRWARPRTLKGETGYRCVFYRVDKAENGYCDCGEREGE